MQKIKVLTKQSWEDITDILTIEGIERLKVGQVLIFDFEGSPIHLKIMRKRKGKVWAKRIHLYTEEEMKTEVRIADKKTGRSTRAIRTKED